MIMTCRQVLLCEINLTYLLAIETNRIHYIAFLDTACFYTDAFMYQLPSCGKYLHGLNGFICNAVGGPYKSIFSFTHVWNTA